MIIRGRRRVTYGIRILVLLAIAAIGLLLVKDRLSSHEGSRLHKMIGIVRALGLGVGGLGAASVAVASSAVAQVPPTVVGMNMGTPSYYSTEWTFNDPIQTTGQLFYFPPGVANAVPFTNQTATDINGRPIDIPARTRFSMAIQNHQRERLVGLYSCRVSPGWTVESGGQRVTVNQNGTSFTINSPKIGYDPRFVLNMTATVDNAALDEFACGSKRGTGVFNPDFLTDVAPFRIVRFMDWMRTNNAPLRVWAERPTPRTLTQAGNKGVALEHMVALCTQLNCDPWFTLPFDVDADYYREFAVYVRDHLPKDRKIYVELSNEVWNGGFSQGRLAVQRGTAQYPGISGAVAGTYYYADRVRDLMKIWDDVFAGQQGRLVRVYASQAANAQRAQIGLDHNDTWRSVDALAVAPYMFQFLQELPGTGSARIDAAFAKGPALIDQAISWSLANKAVAQKYNLQFITYEAGQHYYAYTADAVADLNAMQTDARMYDLYTSYLNRWKKEVGGPLVLFDSAGSGYFEHKSFTGQPLAYAPKMRAVIDFLNTNK